MSPAIPLNGEHRQAAITIMRDRWVPLFKIEPWEIYDLPTLKEACRKLE